MNYIEQRTQAERADSFRGAKTLGMEGLAGFICPSPGDYIPPPSIPCGRCGLLCVRSWPHGGFCDIHFPASGKWGMYNPSFGLINEEKSIIERASDVKWEQSERLWGTRAERDDAQKERNEAFQH